MKIVNQTSNKVKILISKNKILNLNPQSISENFSVMGINKNLLKNISLQYELIVNSDEYRWMITNNIRPKKFSGFKIGKQPNLEEPVELDEEIAIPEEKVSEEVVSESKENVILNNPEENETSDIIEL